MEAKIDNQSQLIKEKYEADINLFLHRLSSLHK